MPALVPEFLVLPAVADSARNGHGLRIALVVLFFLSGMSGLIYEVVWLRMFARALGVTSYATATVLAAFMGGLALGGFVFGRLVDREKTDHLKLYSIIEVVIAALGVLMPLMLAALLPVYRAVYAATNASAAPVLAAKCVLLFFCVLIPTTFMGGTLPLISVYLTRRLGGFSLNLSLLYAWNTVGAVAGVLASAFILLDFFGETRTVLIAVACNLMVAAVSLVLRKQHGAATEPVAPATATPEAAEAADEEMPPPASERLVLCCIFLSGLTALAYEVIWSRHLILYLLTSVYAFATMLAVFLAGLAVGSHVLFRYLDRSGRPLALLAGLQFGVALTSAIGLALFPMLGIITPKDMLANPLNVLWTAVMLFPVAVCFGMTFPTACQCLVRPGAAGRSLGKLYAANTAGNIVGAVAAGFLLIPVVGSGNAMFVLIAANLAIGCALLGAADLSRRSKWGAGLGSVVLIAVFIVCFVERQPFLKLIEARVAAKADAGYRIDANIESAEGTVTAFTLNLDDRGPQAHQNKRLWLNGIGMTFLGTETKLIAHLPMLMLPEAKEMLVICFGMGGTVKSAVDYPGLEITTVDLVDSMFDCYDYFHDDRERVMGCERVHAVAGDGRNYLLMNERLFDVISVDAAPPIYSAGTVNLYTREFFDLCKSRLTADGIMCLWLPAGSEHEMMSISRTFIEAFPNTHVWSGTNYWGLYLMGLPPGRQFEQSEIDAGFPRFPHIATDMSEYGDEPLPWTPARVHDLYLFGPGDVAARFATGVPVTDDYPHTEFPLFDERVRHFLPEQAARLNSR
jgi:spermidine synthase